MSEIKIKLRPFQVPSYVLVEVKAKSKQQGFIEAPKYHLSDLDEQTLIELCDEFKINVLTKAKQGCKDE